MRNELIAEHRNKQKRIAQEQQQIQQQKQQVWENIDIIR